MRWLLAHWRTPCCGSRGRGVLTRLLRRVDHLTCEETTGERRCGSVALSLVDRLRRPRGQASRNRLTPGLCNPRARILTKLASRCFRAIKKIVSKKWGRVKQRTPKVSTRHGGQALRTAVSDSGYNKSPLISVRQRRNRTFAITGCYTPTRVGAHWQAQDKLTALPDRRLIRSLSAFSLAKENQVNENA